MASARKGWVGILTRAAWILALGCGSGMVYNAFSETGIPLRTPDRSPSSELINWELHLEGSLVDLHEAKRAFDGGQTLFLDSRSAEAYAKSHISGAVHIPASQPVQPAKAHLKGLPLDTPIITYCYGGGCRGSMGLARLLEDQFGFTHIRVFHGGWPLWVEAGYPVSAIAP